MNVRICRIFEENWGEIIKKEVEELNIESINNDIKKQINT